MQPSLAKPFAAAWRARAYFAFALLFWVVFAAAPPILEGIFPNPRQGWQDFILKSAGSFDKFAYFTALAGLLYAVISDVIDYVWTNSLQAELRKGFSDTGNIITTALSNFTSGLMGMSFESVKVWIEGGLGGKPQLRVLAETALVSTYGRHNLGQDSIVALVMNGLLDTWAVGTAQIWEQFTSVVILRKSPLKNYFQWEETRRYTLICFSQTGEVPIDLEGSARIQSNEVAATLDEMEFWARFGSTKVIDLKSWWAKYKSHATGRDKFRIEGDGIILEYDGIWLTYTCKCNCLITSERTDVTVYEKSYISNEDRCYSLINRHPTKGMRVSLSIEGVEDWVVKSPVVSADFYKREGRIVQIDRPHDQSCQWHTQEWVLPGIAMTIEWSPGRT
jgi:hypothetical protein